MRDDNCLRKDRRHTCWSDLEVYHTPTQVISKWADYTVNFFSLSIAKDSVKQVKSVTFPSLREYVALNNIQMVQWCNLVTGYLLNMCEALGFIPSTHPAPPKNTGVGGSSKKRSFSPRLELNCLSPGPFASAAAVHPLQDRAGAWTPGGSRQGTTRK